MSKICYVKHSCATAAVKNEVNFESVAGHVWPSLALTLICWFNIKNLKFQYENGLCSLAIDRCLVADAGEYCCLAENEHGTSKTVAYVSVQGDESPELIKPIFKDPLIDILTVEGNEIILECRATGKPMPSISWFKDGIKLFLENRMLSYTDRKGVCRLNIINASRADSGEYSCEAVNKSGRDYTHCLVTVAGKSQIFFRNFWTEGPISQGSGPRSKVQHLRAQVQGPRSNIAGLRSKFQILQNIPIAVGSRKIWSVGNPIFKTKKCQFWTKNKSFWINCEFCKTINSFWKTILEVPGAPSRLSTPSSLRSTPSRSSPSRVSTGKAPQIIRPLADVTVMEGRRAAMSCELEAHPSPEIEWFKDGRVSP